MRIRHLVAADNVDEQGYIVDPLLVRHGIVLAGQIADLAGPIDPLTHLNLEFPDHQLDQCLVAERLERGAALLWDRDRFRLALLRPERVAGLVLVDAAPPDMALKPREANRGGVPMPSAPVLSFGARFAPALVKAG